MRLARYGLLLALAATAALGLAAPVGCGSVVARLGASTEFGLPLRLGVVKDRGRWLGVVSTRLPNGRLGWVKRSEVYLRTTEISLELDLSRRLLFLKRGDEVVRRMVVGVGRPSSPTPKGHFAVTDKLSGSRYSSAYRSAPPSSFTASGYMPAMGRQLSLDETAAPLVPETASLTKLRQAAAGCKACDLWKTGPQTVFGEGKREAEIIFVGEQPGDQEDQQGKPFVGPAGRVLDEGLEEAGIDRALAYVTNVVKHFKWEPRGKRRIHAKPNAREIGACRPWLETEIALVKPRVLMCLGATAAQALLGKTFKVSQQRGEFVPSSLAPFVTATVHPSSILRATDDDARREEMRRFVEDLLKVAAELT